MLPTTAVELRVLRSLVIEPNREDLESFGGLPSEPAIPGYNGGRPSTAYHLNRQQALPVCILSRTERGK